MKNLIILIFYLLLIQSTLGQTTDELKYVAYALAEKEALQKEAAMDNLRSSWRLILQARDLFFTSREEIRNEEEQREKIQAEAGDFYHTDQRLQHLLRHWKHANQEAFELYHKAFKATYEVTKKFNLASFTQGLTHEDLKIVLAYVSETQLMRQRTAHARQEALAYFTSKLLSIMNSKSRELEVKSKPCIKLW